MRVRASVFTEAVKSTVIEFLKDAVCCGFWNFAGNSQPVDAHSSAVGLIGEGIVLFLGGVYPVVAVINRFLDWPGELRGEAFGCQPPHGKKLFGPARRRSFVLEGHSSR